jgi:hypothetical protein
MLCEVSEGAGKFLSRDFAGTVRKNTGAPLDSGGSTRHARQSFYAILGVCPAAPTAPSFPKMLGSLMTMRLPSPIPTPQSPVTL